jgi:hypothetical protein
MVHGQKEIDDRRASSGGDVSNFFGTLAFTTPVRVEAVIHTETQFGYALFRTQLFNMADPPNVSKIQPGYNAEPGGRISWRSVMRITSCA